MKRLLVFTVLGFGFITVLGACACRQQESPQVAGSRTRQQEEERVRDQWEDWYSEKGILPPRNPALTERNQELLAAILNEFGAGKGNFYPAEAEDEVSFFADQLCDSQKTCDLVQLDIPSERLSLGSQVFIQHWGPPENMVAQLWDYDGDGTVNRLGGGGKVVFCTLDPAVLPVTEVRPNCQELYNTWLQATLQKLKARPVG